MSTSASAQEAPQTLASDPRRSAWVSANAGSGKTTVLVQRVIRLLLDGAPPGRILCLTYTKAAAAHMANEVLKKLAAWVRLDDEALDAEIAKIESGEPSPQRRARARRLFATALETPGGLKVQTIHAFCDRVLHMFPVEAEAPAGFDVLDELGERGLIENARLQVLLDAGKKPDSALGRALAYCIEIAGDDTIGQVIGEAIRERQKLRGVDVKAARAAMQACLQLEQNDSPESIAKEILEKSALPRSEWESIGLSLQSLGGSAENIGDGLLRAARAKPAEALEQYLEVFFTDKGKPKADPTFGAEKSLATINGIRERLLQERDRLVPLIDKLRAARECERSCALLLVAGEVIARYEDAKRRRGVLDFADLVTKTVALLEREASAWVHFKLDGGIDHILVDEAQDTSPEQWRIIAKLAEEFFAGKGASERSRTIFAVGDEKQSIFSFQGADPASFAKMRDHFSQKLNAASDALEQPRLRMSFRSTTTVLGAVDKVFEPEEARKGLSAHDDQGPFHEAVRQKAPGVVEIWPAIKADAGDPDERGWDKPLDKMRETSARMQLANRIAKAVQQWIHGGLTVGDRDKGDKPRAVEPRDIIILVQSRGPLFDAILRALKREHIPVAGADRLKLTENIAVMDLMALGDALLLSEDDLSLACVLKSPLFNFTDKDLFALCHEREGTLASSLAASKSEPKYADAAKTLTLWRESARHLRPFDLYSRILGRDGGRRRMVARLGPEAADALDEFLAAALSYEQTETPSLHGFLSLLRRAGTEVKRDLEAEGTSVRVMTVHGVKGLEAPVIVLADTTSLPPQQKEPRMVGVPLAGAEDALLIWTTRKEKLSNATSAARDYARELRKQEYRRLLYVALTRAADVLVVCGALRKKPEQAESGTWYDLVHTALASDAANITKHKGYSGEEILRWRTPEFPPLAMQRDPAEKPVTELPGWLENSWIERDRARVRLRPSVANRDFSRASQDPQGGGKRRGILLHRLLQSLPELSSAEREAAALRYLDHAAPDLREEMRAALAKEALRVITEKNCAAVFSPDSRAEVELIARIPEGGRDLEIAARLDRLAISEREIIFADFKSHALVPSSADEVPAHYLEQLAAYRAALMQAFPGKPIRAFLIFTAVPRVFEIPAESLEFAWTKMKTQDSLAFA